MRPATHTTAQRRRILLRALRDQSTVAAEALYYRALIVRQAHRSGCTTAQIAKASGLTADEVLQIVNDRPRHPARE